MRTLRVWHLKRTLSYTAILLITLNFLCPLISCGPSKQVTTDRAHRYKSKKSQKYYENAADEILKGYPIEVMKLGRVVEEGLRFYPNSSVLWLYKGHYHRFAKNAFPNQDRLALEAAKKALDLNPSGPVYSLLGQIYQEMKNDCHTALTYYRRLETTGHGSKWPKLYQQMALCFEKLQNYEDAKSYYSRYLKVAPRNACVSCVRKRLASLMGMSGDIKSQKYYEDLARTAWKSKDAERLKEILDESLLFYPNSSVLWSCKVWYYLNTPSSNQKQLALEAAKQALELSPSSPTYSANVGWVYQKLFEDFTSALDFYEKGEDYAKKNPNLYYNMAFCYEKLEKISQATSYYKRYLKVEPKGKHALQARKNLAHLGSRKSTGSGQFETAEPIIRIHELKLKPPTVTAGSAFDFFVKYTVMDHKVEQERLLTTMTFRIFDAKKVVFRSDPVEIMTINGKSTTWKQPMTASKRKGSYKLTITIDYRDDQIKKSRNLNIK